MAFYYKLQHAPHMWIGNYTIVVSYLKLVLDIRWAEEFYIISDLNKNFVSIVVISNFDQA